MVCGRGSEPVQLVLRIDDERTINARRGEQEENEKTTDGYGIDLRFQPARLDRNVGRAPRATNTFARG